METLGQLCFRASNNLALMFTKAQQLLNLLMLQVGMKRKLSEEIKKTLDIFVVMGMRMCPRRQVPLEEQERFLKRPIAEGILNNEG